MAKETRHGDDDRLEDLLSHAFPSLPGLRRVEAELYRMLHPGQPDDSRTEAQHLIYTAFDEPNPKRRVEIAREALSIDPVCVDAYNIIAGAATTPREELEGYEKALKAATTAIPADRIDREMGSLWDSLDTRPYLRAKMGHTYSLWLNSRRAEAIASAHELLRLDSGDHQHTRITLLTWLILENRDSEASVEVEKIPEKTSASYLFTRALLAFRKEGDTTRSRELLKQARDANPHVTRFLDYVGSMPPAAESVIIGHESEAIAYATHYLPVWRASRDAVSWLRDTGPRNPKAETLPPAKGPLGFIKNWLRKNLLPTDDVWQFDFKQLNRWVSNENEHYRPWIACVLSTVTGLVLTQEIYCDRPTYKHLWDLLVQGMQNPFGDEPHLPGEILVTAREEITVLQKHLQEIGVPMTVCQELPEFQAMIKDMEEHTGGNVGPSILEVPMMKPEMLAGFYDAAAYFFRKAPWLKMGYEATLKVECDKFQSGPWYGIIMGQMGMTYGFTLYDRLKTLRRLQTGDLSDSEGARLSTALSVLYGEESDIHPSELDAIRMHGWPIADRFAYPSVFRKERGMTMRSPLVWELELMEGCLRAVPLHLERCLPDNPDVHSYTVDVASGRLTLTLSWMS